MGTVITDINSPVHKINEKLVLQQLGESKPIEQEILTGVFKAKKNVEATAVSRKFVERTIKAIPYVSAGTDGVALNGEKTNWDSITVPPMKANLTLLPDDLDQARELNGKDFNAWLRDELSFIRETISWNKEWYARHFLADGNCSYPFLVGDTWNKEEYALGTMPVTANPAVAFDNASATISGIVRHLDLMLETGKDHPTRNYFQNSSSIMTLARKNVWNAIHELLNDRRTNDVIGSRRISAEEIMVGNYVIKKFDGERIDPETQSATNSIPVKELRMIDTSAPHTLAHLRLSNFNATGGQKHVLINVDRDKNGNWVTIEVQYRLLGLFIPEAMVSGGTVLT